MPGDDRTGPDRSVHAIVLTGAGSRAFSASLDLKELGADIGSLGGTKTRTENDDPVAAIASCPQPVIGAINGVAITGGFELALACDILIASTNARFADTHARVGIMPGWGLSQKLSRIVGLSRAKEISLTGNFVTAEQALDWGLVNHVVAPDALLPKARAIARDIASAAPSMIASYKRLIDDGHALALTEALALERERSRAANLQVTAEEVEARRLDVVERGRAFG